MAIEYCSTADLYSYGLPRGALSNPARVAESALAADDVIHLGEHGFSDGDPVSFRAEAGGSLPAPLARGVEYYAIRVSDHAFRISDDEGGPPVDLTTDGLGVLVIAALPRVKHIRAASALINELAPANCVPFDEPYPEVVRSSAAVLAVSTLLAFCGQSSRPFADVVKEVRLQLATWAKGAPIRAPETTPSAVLAARSEQAPPSLSVCLDDPKGWGTYGGIS